MITLRVPQGAGGIWGGTEQGAMKPAPILCWETPFPVLNLGESWVCFVEGGSIPLPAPPESLHLSRSFGDKLHSSVCPGQERRLQ